MAIPLILASRDIGAWNNTHVLFSLDAQPRKVGWTLAVHVNNSNNFFMSRPLRITILITLGLMSVLALQGFCRYQRESQERMRQITVDLATFNTEQRALINSGPSVADEKAAHDAEMAKLKAEDERRELHTQRSLAFMSAQDMIIRTRDEKVAQLDLDISRSKLWVLTGTITYTDSIQRIAKAIELKTAATNDAVLEEEKLATQYPDIKSSP